jgi:hypothetical protein
VVVLLAGGCGEDARDRVDAYLDDANAIQRDSADELKQANRIYVRYAQGRLDADTAVPALERAERSIRSTRSRVAGLDPPDEARRMHRLLIRYFDAGSGLARETSELGRYVRAASRELGALRRLNARLGRSLRVAGSPAEQSAALTRYADALGGPVARLRRLPPPPVLKPAHDRQLARLASAHSLAGRLATAVERREARRVARLLLRFRRLTARPRRAGPDSAALRAYNGRQRRLLDAAGAAERERQRLERALR